jgi:hypothetical protein
MKKYYACGNCRWVFVSHNDLTEHFTNAKCSSVKCELLNEEDREKKIRENVDRLLITSLISNKITNITNSKKEKRMFPSKLSGDDKRVQSCKLVGGVKKKEGHHKENTFNAKFNPECKKITMKAEADCQISEEHSILDKLIKKGIIKDKKERNTSNKSGKSIQIVLGKIPELQGDDNLEWIEIKDNFKQLLEKYLKKSESKRPANLLVYDTNQSRLFYNMDDIIKYMVENCKFRKLKSGRIKGDFKDNSKKGKRQYFTYEYRGKNHKSHFIGFSGGKGKPFIELLKTKIKYYEDPY